MQVVLSTALHCQQYAGDREQLEVQDLGRLEAVEVCTVQALEVCPDRCLGAMEGQPSERASFGSQAAKVCHRFQTAHVVSTHTVDPTIALSLEFYWVRPKVDAADR